MSKASGGFTVLAIDHDVRVKASDVFRRDFAGKENSHDWEDIVRNRTEAEALTGSIARQIAMVNLWRVDRQTGDVSPPDPHFP